MGANGCYLTDPLFQHKKCAVFESFLTFLCVLAQFGAI